MRSNLSKKIKMIFIVALTALLVIALIQSKMMSRTKDFEVHKEYISTSTNEVLSPLDAMDINKKSITISIDGNVHMSVDSNNKSTNFLNPKNRFEFVGEINFGDHKLTFDEKNPLISTELLLNDKWSIYASQIVTTTSTINEKLYFFGATVMHDQDYNIESMSLDIYDTGKSLIGRFTYEF